MKFRYLLFAVALSGCTSAWVPVGHDSVYTQQEAETRCSQEAFKVLPIKNEIATETTYEKPPLICEDGNNKKSKKKKGKCYVDSYALQLKSTKTRSYVLDVNEDSRKSYQTRCMNNMGWKRVDLFLWEK